MKLDTQLDTLCYYKKRGADSPLLEAAIAFGEVKGDLRYAEMVGHVDRIHPSMLPTQASGRWSTARPPLVNFPPEMDNVIIPDEGWWFACWDLDAVEARLHSLFCSDKDDLLAFNKGWDIHTLTTCAIWEHILPPDCRNPHVSTEWCQSWSPVWEGKTDRRRHLTKTARYGLTYSLGEEIAILNVKDVEKLNLSHEELLNFARRYLQSKSETVSRNRQLAYQMAEAGVSRTLRGRRRMLYGANHNERARIGYSHMVSGTVADKMDLDFITIARKYPQAYLVKNGHDSGIWAFPVEMAVNCVLADLDHIITEHVEYEGRRVTLTASWEWWDSNGIHHKWSNIS